MAKVKISELPEIQSIGGLYTIGVDSNGDSVKVPMGNILDSKANSEDLNTHVNSKSNPHKVTKSQVGLGSVTNHAQVKRTEMGVANGVATLDGDGKVHMNQINTGDNGVVTKLNGKILPADLPSSVYDIVRFSTFADGVYTAVQIEQSVGSFSSNDSGVEIYFDGANKTFIAGFPVNNNYLYYQEWADSNSFMTGQDSTGSQKGTPRIDKIYNYNDSKQYAWNGNEMIAISEHLKIGETATTAFAGNRGKELEDKLGGKDEKEIKLLDTENSGAVVKNQAILGSNHLIIGQASTPQTQWEAIQRAKLAAGHGLYIADYEPTFDGENYHFKVDKKGVEYCVTRWQDAAEGYTPQANGVALYHRFEDAGILNFILGMPHWVSHQYAINLKLDRTNLQGWNEASYVVPWSINADGNAMFKRIFGETTTYNISNKSDALASTKFVHNVVDDARTSDIQLMIYGKGLYVIANPDVIKSGWKAKFARYTKSKSRYKFHTLNKSYRMRKKGWIVPKYTPADNEPQVDLFALSLVDVTDDFKYFSEIGKKIYEVNCEATDYSGSIIDVISQYIIIEATGKTTPIKLVDKKLGIRLFDVNNNPKTDWLPFSLRHNSAGGESEYSLSRWI